MPDSVIASGGFNHECVWSWNQVVAAAYDTSTGSVEFSKVSSPDVQMLMRTEISGELWSVKMAGIEHSDKQTVPYTAQTPFICYGALQSVVMQELLRV